MKKIFFAFSIITLVGVILLSRFYHLGSQPPGLHIDEVSFGMEAKVLADTGKDTWGESWPLYFKAFGEYKAPGLIYATIPFIKLNDNQITTTISRLPAAVMGMLSLLAVYLVIGVIWPGATILQKVLITSILAFSPWHFGSSRVYFETSGGSAWLMIGICLLINMYLVSSIKAKRLSWVFAIVAIVISGYWYASFRYIGLAILIVAWIFLKNTWIEKKKLALVMIALILTIGIGWVKEIVSTKGLSRLSQFTAETEYGASLVANQKREFCHLSFDANPKLVKLCYLIWNKPVIRLDSMATYLIEYLSPRYLFSNSGGEYGVDGDYGTYLLPAVVPYVVGFAFLLWSLFKNFHSGIGVVLIWLIISFIPASFTGSLNIHRSVVGLYLVMIVIIFGVREIYLTLINISPKLNFIFWFGYIAAFLFYLVQSQANYFLVYTHGHDLLWTSDTQEVYEYVVEQSPEYDRIIDTALHGPLAAGFYGGLTSEEILRTGVHSTPNPEGWTYLVKAGKYELINRELRDLACEKWGESDSRKTLVITEKIADTAATSELTTYSWNKVDKMHQVYDLDKFIAYELDHNSSFRNTCTKK